MCVCARSRARVCVCVVGRGLKCGEEEGNWKVGRVSPSPSAAQGLSPYLIEAQMQRMVSESNTFFSYCQIVSLISTAAMFKKKWKKKHDENQLLNLGNVRALCLLELAQLG